VNFSQILGNHSKIVLDGRISLPFILLSAIFLFTAQVSYAQDPETTVDTPEMILGDSLIMADTIPPMAQDTIVYSTDSTSADSTSANSYRSDIETTIKYSAKDSIIFSVDGKKVWLYGDAVIDYGEIKLEAANIEIDWSTSMLKATGVIDSLGKMQGKPVFQDGNQVYETREIKYNFVTSRAYIKGVVTEQGDGYMHGTQVKMNEKNELFIRNAKYTTCNHANPHFFIRARKIKVIPDDKVVAGLFNLDIAGVPTPLGFPFGMFPAQDERKSGIIFPTYGEEARRGFFMREGGYFFALSDYANLEVTGDIYTKGSWGVRVASTYTKRYAYRGNFLFNYTYQNIAEVGEEKSISRDFRLSWSHSPQSRGSGRFSANINAVTSSYSQNNALDVTSNSRTNFTSNVSYQKTFKGTPFSMGLNGRFTQNVQTKAVNLLLPEFSFNMQNIYPFQKAGSTGSKWWERIAIKWAMNGTNQINNTVSSDSIAPFTIENIPEFFENAKRGIRHTIPLGTSIPLLKFFTLTPNFNYTERWYFEKYDYSYDDALGTVVTDTISGFNRVYDYSGGVGLNTRLYGTHFFNGKKIQAIRHVMNPSVGFSYRPDFSDPKFDIYQTVQTDSTGRTAIRNRYQGFVYGSPGIGEAQTLNFSIANNLEMKVADKKDTVNTFRKVKLFNNLGISSSYNFLADSFKLAPISMAANTALFRNKLSLNLRGVVDPYTYELVTSEDGTVSERRTDRYSWNTGNGLGRLTNFNIAASTNLNPKAFESQQRIENSNATEEQKEFLLNNPEAYVDFNIPWSLRIQYSVNYRKTSIEPANIKQTMRFSGDVSVTPKTKIGFTSGYDFEAKTVTDTNFNVTRDLHCWTLQFDWRPFGRFESFNFTIRAKSALLQDLKFERKSNFFDSF